MVPHVTATAASMELHRVYLRQSKHVFHFLLQQCHLQVQVAAGFVVVAECGVLDSVAVVVALLRDSNCERRMTPGMLLPLPWMARLGMDEASRVLCRSDCWLCCCGKRLDAIMVETLSSTKLW